MSYNLFNILTGIMIIFLVSYFLIGIYTSLYIKYATKKTEKKDKFFLSVAIATLAWFGSTILAIWAASSASVIAFALVAMVFIFTVNFFLTEKLFGIGGKHKIIFSLLLALVLNPAWLSVVGII